MLSLHQLVTAQASVLLIDASSSRIQVGLWNGPDRVRWAFSEAEAGVGIFLGVESLGIDPGKISAFAFAEGPGSVLGIRLAAAALRVWTALAPRPLFAYHALPLLAAATGRPELTFIADARRGDWHCFRWGGGLQRRPTAELTGPLATAEEFRHWTPLPPAVEKIPYHIDHLLARAAQAPIFRSVTEPEAFLAEAPRYATWSAQIHRAAPAPSS